MSRNNRKMYANQVKINNTNERIRWYKAIKGLMKNKKLSQALTEIEEYVEMYPDDIFGRLLYGNILMNLGYTDQAKKIFEYLVEIEAKNMYSALYYMACIERGQNNNDKAEKLLYRVIEESPYDEDFAKLELASIENEKGNLRKVEEIVKTISKEHEGYKYLELVKIRLNQNRTLEAFELLTRIKESDNKIFNRKLLLEKGRVNEALGDYDDAKRCFDEVLKGPRNGVYYMALVSIAKIDVNMGNNKEAINICNNIKGLNKNLDTDIYQIMGNIYEKVDDYDKARKYYLKNVDSIKSYKKDKALFSLGQLEYKLDNYDKALEYFKKISYNGSYLRGALFNIVHVQIRKKDYKMASIQLEKIKNNYSYLINDLEEYRKLRILLDKRLNRKQMITTNLSYGERQYTNYSVKDAIDHIKCEHISNESRVKSNFYDWVDVAELIKSIKSKLTRKNLYYRDLSDIYIIDYNDIGITENNEVANAIKVVTIPNTLDIITMYPVNKQVYKKEIVEKSHPKTKRLSQIEKFNKKYNLK